MKRNAPKVKVLRSANDDFIGAYPDTDAKFPSKYPCEDMFLRGSVASANDCTGIAVVQPEDGDAAESLAELCDFPVSAADGSVAGDEIP